MKKITFDLSVTPEIDTNIDGSINLHPSGLSIQISKVLMNHELKMKKLDAEREALIMDLIKTLNTLK